MGNAQNNGSRLTLHLFKKLIPVQLLSSITVSLCSIINTLIINTALGETGLSQFKVVDAFTNIIVIFGFILTSGEILLMSRAICNGEREVSNRCFSTAVTASVVFSVLICAACLFFAEPICTFFGADETMLPNCCGVLRGYMIYYITLPLCSVFLSLFQIRSDLKTPIIASVIAFMLNISLNFIFLCVLHLNLHYAALACSFAQFITLVFLLFRHSRKKLAYYSLRNVSLPYTGTLIAVGITEASAHIWSAIKASFMIKLMAHFGGAQALSCFSIISSVDAVTFSLFGASIPLVTLMIAGIFINEGDRASLRRFVKTAFIIGCSAAFVLSAVMFFSAYPVARLYNVADVAAHIKAQRIFSCAFIFYMPYTILLTLYAALGKVKSVNIISFLTALILPLLSMALLGSLFGITGFWHGLFVGDLLSFIITFSYNIFKNGHFPHSVDDILCLESDFGVSADNSLTLSVKSVDDAAKASEKIMDFCSEHGIDGHTAYMSGLCLEEIAVNIVTHGFRHTKKEGIVELVVINEPKNVKLIVRDNCVEFDPYEKLAHCDRNDMAKGVGIRLVTKIAETSYKNMYGLNITTMTVKKPESTL